MSPRPHSYWNKLADMIEQAVGKDDVVLSHGIFMLPVDWKHIILALRSGSNGPKLPDPNERLMVALESCANKLAALGREFSSINFTDRYGDGPICTGLAKHARAVLDEVRAYGESTTATQQRPIPPCAWEDSGA
jgi:hypothetical protein